MSNWKPKISVQLDSERNCGQHCVAMITHLPVSLVSEFLLTNIVTSAKKVCGVLRWFGYYAGDSKVLWRRLEGLPELCILHVRRTGGWL